MNAEINPETRQLLRARAEALSRPPEGHGGEPDALEMIEFVLASETYALESRFIREIYPLRELTPIPCTPAFVMGMINVRGQILTVINIKMFFGLPEQGLSELNKVIIVQVGEMELGMLADAVLGVRVLSPHDIQSSLPIVSGIRADYLRGVTPERLVILDIAAVLSDPRILVQEEVEV